MFYICKYLVRIGISAIADISLLSSSWMIKNDLDEEEKIGFPLFKCPAGAHGQRQAFAMNHTQTLPSIQPQPMFVYPSLSSLVNTNGWLTLIWSTKQLQALGLLLLHSPPPNSGGWRSRFIHSSSRQTHVAEEERRS